MFLSHYEGDNFLDRIITTDRTWLHHFDPETKAMFSVWKTPQYTSPEEGTRTEKCWLTHVHLLHGSAWDDLATQGTRWPDCNCHILF